MKTTLAVLAIICIAWGVSQGAWHQVQPGETLADIAAKHGNSVNALLAMNQIEDADSIQVGDQIRYIEENDVESIPCSFVDDRGRPLDLSTITANLLLVSTSPRDLITKTVVQDAQLWCQHMMNGYDPSHTSYQYFQESWLHLAAREIRFPGDPKEKPGEFYIRVLHMARNWREAVLRGHV